MNPDNDRHSAWLATQATRRNEEAHNIAGGRPLVRAAQAQLRMSTIGFDANSLHLAEPTGSPHLEQLKEKLGDVGLNRMFSRQVEVHQLATQMRAQDYPRQDIGTMIPRRMAQLGDLPNSAMSRLKVQSGGGDKNYYDPADNRIQLINSHKLPFAAHEMRHAYDHLTGKLDLKTPTHNLHAEFNAFSTQQIVADQLGQDSEVYGSPLEHARTYETKQRLRDLYPGTVESSREAVAQWAAQPAQVATQARRLNPFQPVRDAMHHQRQYTWQRENDDAPWVRSSS
jgi:hypothetical protein